MKWLYITGIVVFAIGFVYYLNPDDDELPLSFPQELADEPNVRIEGFTLTQYDRQGERLYEINAGQAATYEATRETMINRIHVRLFEVAAKGAWELYADNGRYFAGEALPYLRLQGNVQLISMADSSEAAFKFTTESLRIEPYRNFVESLSKVSMQGSGSNIHADRFEADLASGMFRFSSNVDSQVELQFQQDS